MSSLKYFLLCLVLAAPMWGAFPSGGSYLGISVGETTADNGVEIVRVSNESPAAKAGLKAGDVLLTYNGEAIMGAQQLGRLVWETPPGRRVKVQISREGKSEVVIVTTGAPPVPVRIADAPTSEWPSQPQSAFSDIPVASICWRNMILGIEYEILSSQLAVSFGVHDGLLVRVVESGSPSDKAGLKPGDVLVEMNGRDIGDRQDLSNVLRSPGTPGKALSMSVMRNHKRLALSLQVSE